MSSKVSLLKVGSEIDKDTMLKAETYQELKDKIDKRLSKKYCDWGTQFGKLIVA